MKTIRSTLLAPVALLVIGLGSCRKDANPTPAAGIQRDSLNMGSLTLRHLKCADPKRTIEYGLVAWYPFLGNADDWSGHGNKGTVTGATLTAGKSGHKNSAYSFNGFSDWIDLPLSMGDSVVQFSIYARVKASSTGTLWSSGDTYKNPFCSLNVSPTSILYGAQKPYELQGFPHVFLINITAWGDIPSAPAGTWNDIVANFSDNVLSIYVNGSLVSLSLYIESGVSGVDKIPAPKLEGILVGAAFNSYNIAVLGESGYVGYLTGVVDELRFYNRPLTTDEIDYLYKH